MFSLLVKSSVTVTAKNKDGMSDPHSYIMHDSDYIKALKYVL